jgi:hypothetical protein
VTFDLDLSNENNDGGKARLFPEPPNKNTGFSTQHQATLPFVIGLTSIGLRLLALQWQNNIIILSTFISPFMSINISYPHHNESVSTSRSRIENR